MNSRILKLLFSVLILSSEALGIASPGSPPPLTQPAPGVADWPATSQYKPFTCGGISANDPIGDAAGAQNERDIVGNAAFPAAYYYNTSNFLFIRLRLEESPLDNGGNLDPFGWGFAFDTDGSKAGKGYEYAWIVNGIGNQETFSLYNYPANTNGGNILAESDRADWVKTSVVPPSQFGGGCGWVSRGCDSSAEFSDP